MNSPTPHVMQTKQLSIMRLIACGTIVLGLSCGQDSEKDTDFFTSGSREADQRAEEQVARAQQLRGEGSGDEGESKASLFERIGGEQGINAIVEDFVQRAMADPRVNWSREGVRHGGVLGVRRKSSTWNADAQRVDQLKKHMAQFLALATGGPVQYDGRGMREVHRNMKITNAEFDAAMGDLRATLENLGVPIQEQKELLAVVESTRPQIVEQR